MCLNKIPGRTRIYVRAANLYCKAGLRVPSPKAPELFLPFAVLPSRWLQSPVPEPPSGVRQPAAAGAGRCQVLPFLRKASGFALKLESSENPAGVLRSGFSRTSGWHQRRYIRTEADWPSSVPDDLFRRDFVRIKSACGKEAGMILAGNAFRSLPTAKGGPLEVETREGGAFWTRLWKELMGGTYGAGWWAGWGQPGLVLNVREQTEWAAWLRARKVKPTGLFARRVA